MPNIKVLDMSGKDAGTKDLSDNIFDAKINNSLLHSVVRAYLLNQRLGTHSTLTRAEVRGGGKKPWRQKGTGRARQGSTRSPNWTHGGVAFGPKPRSYRVAINKKAKRAALKGALTSKVKGGELIIVDSIKIDEFKTKPVVEMLKALGFEKKALIVVEEHNEKLIKSAANIPGVKTAMANNLNVYDILNCGKFIVSSGAIDKIEEVYA
ncbi:MAG: 50S ribosomal protein L4 [Oscillospiraceae bacterium]|nr:50S ribosomal protein L4 [Oscillospiraceae bacterium]